MLYICGTSGITVIIRCERLFLKPNEIHLYLNTFSFRISVFDTPDVSGYSEKQRQKTPKQH